MTGILEAVPGCHALDPGHKTLVLGLRIHDPCPRTRLVEAESLEELRDHTVDPLVRVRDSLPGDLQPHLGVEVVSLLILVIFQGKIVFISWIIILSTKYNNYFII